MAWTECSWMGAEGLSCHKYKQIARGIKREMNGKNGLMIKGSGEIKKGERKRKGRDACMQKLNLLTA